MIDSIIHLITAGLMLFLFVKMMQLSRQNKSIWTMAAASVVFGLIWDNFVLGLGRFLGEGDLLKTLSYPRFWLHALLTPLMIMFVWYLLRRDGVKWAQGMTAYAIFGTLTLLAIAIGVNDEMIKLNLAFAPGADIVRYRNAASSGPPIPAILAVLVVIFGGVILWVRHKWWGLAVGAATMFIFTAAGSRLPGVFANLGELTLVLGCYFADKRMKGIYVPFTRKK